MNKPTTKAITFLFIGFLFVTGVAAQDTKTGANPPCPPTAKPAQPVINPRGAGIGVPTGAGVGAANGTGIGAANGTGIGASTAAGSGLGRIGVGSDTPEISVRTLVGIQAITRARASRQTGAAAGTGIGAATGTGVGTAPATPAETTPPVAPEKVLRTYIKEMDGSCYYVTNDGEKAYVAPKKCELY